MPKIDLYITKREFIIFLIGLVVGYLFSHIFILAIFIGMAIGYMMVEYLRKFLHHIKIFGVH